MGGCGVRRRPRREPRLADRGAAGDDGALELRASAPDKDAAGEYELRLTALAEPSAGRIRPGEKVGRLDRTDSEGLFGYEDHYLIQGPPGDTVTIYLESDEFDTSMAFGLWREDLRLPAFDDDTGPGNDSRLTVTFAPSAAHRLVVHAVSPGETGAYTLRVLAGVHRGDPGGAGRCRALHPSREVHPLTAAWLPVSYESGKHRTEGSRSF